LQVTISRCFEMLAVHVDSRFETMRTDPRFSALLRRIGIR
jgi:hypothetical protein